MRLRLILSFILVVLVSIASVVVAARASTANTVREFMFRGGMAGSEGLVAGLEDYYQSHQTWQGVESLFTMPGHGNGAGGMGQGMGMGGGAGMMNQRLRLADAKGSLVVDTLNPNPSGALSQAEIDQSIPLQVDGQTVGYLFPEGGLAFTPSDQSNLVRRLNQGALTGGLIGGGLALLLALLLAYGLLRPVRDLTLASQQLASGDLSRRVPLHGQDELAQLGSAFNQMADSLQQAHQTRQAMTADIAHELRNPLAVQRAHLEALQDGIYALTVENLNPVLEQNHLLTRLVEDLRTLSLADSGQLTLDKTSVDLPELVSRAVERFTPQADSRQIQIRVDAAPGLAVLADPMRLEQILSNLLANALRYTPESGTIWVRVFQDSGQAVITLRDSGPGFPEEALPHLFERFFRADPSRSRAQGGSGLGLAIARQLAQAHGGTLTAENSPQGGAVLRLALPLK